MAVYAFTNLETPSNVTSGIADYILLAPVYDFDEIMCPEAPFVAAGDSIKIKTAHSFKVDRAFAKLICSPNLNSLTGASIGDLGFKKQDQTIECTIPGSYAEVHEAIENYMNQPLIALVKDAECSADLWYQLGCDCVYAWMDATFTTGTTADGKKGYVVKINCKAAGIRLYEVDGGPAILA
jgi:hypothetical protein